MAQELKPIVFNRASVAPVAKSAPKGAVTVVTKPGTPPAEPIPQGPDQAALREEFDDLSTKLRMHQLGEAPMEEDAYKRALARALDIVTLFNQTSAGPRATNKKGKAAAPTPVSLSDL